MGYCSRVAVHEAVRGRKAKRRVAAPPALVPADAERVMAMGRDAGNRALTRLLRRSLPVEPAHGVLEARAKGLSQPAASTAGRSAAPPGVANGVATARGAGRPLPPDVLSGMERRYGADFRDVRLHRGREAAAMNDRLRAKAFTTGADIFLRNPEQSLDSGQGRRLIAHELAHVVQQRSGEAPAGAIQRYCGVPGCQDPNCHDEKNHGFDRFHDLRSGPLYNFQINPQDRGTGTGTSKDTRGYVNDPNTPVPEQIRMSYGSGSQTGHTEFQNAPLQPGQKWDAGHIKGRQNAGLGHDRAGVFPQNPKQNRGNSLGGEKTFDLWRRHEDNQNKWAKSSPVNVSVKLNKQTRQQYDEMDISQEEEEAFLEYWGVDSSGPDEDWDPNNQQPPPGSGSAMAF